MKWLNFIHSEYFFLYQSIRMLKLKTAAFKSKWKLFGIIGHCSYQYFQHYYTFLSVCNVSDGNSIILHTGRSLWISLVSTKRNRTINVPSVCYKFIRWKLFCFSAVEQISSRDDKSQSSDLIAIPVAIILSIMVIVAIIILLLRYYLLFYLQRT